MAQGGSTLLTNTVKLGSNTIATNAGNADAGTQRVVLATNQAVIPVSDNGGSITVDGTFWPTTQPVSIASMPTTPVTGTFYQATQPVSIAAMPTTPVTGTFWQVTQPVSAAALPLPTGAATAAKQPALGTAGTASTDVITVQGIVGGIAQPVSGTVTVSQATAGNLNATVTGTVELGATSLAALENISVTVPGTVDLGTVSLTALETITVISGTPGNFQSRGYGAVTTAAPAYTTGTDNALSLTTSGALRIDGSGVTQPVSGTFWQATQPVSIATIPTHAVTQSGTWIFTGAAANGAAVSGNPVLIAGSDGTVARSIKTATDGTLLVNGVQDARTAGSITSATSVVGPVSVNNRNVVTITVSGTHAGITFLIEATDDGTNWFGLQSINNATGQASAAWTPGTNGVASYDSAVGGYTQIRIRATAWTSGTAVIGISSQVFAYDPVVAALSQGLSANGAAVSGNPVLMGGSDGTNARSLATSTGGVLYTRLYDGTNFATLKAASTAAVAADPALVVAISPNNILQVKTVPDATATYAPTNATTTAYAASLIAKASAGKLIMITGYNSKTTTQFIQVHNTATLPADAAVPVLVFIIPPTSNFSLDMGSYGRYFSTGITICNSTTGPTKTIGAADCWFDVQYV